MMVEVATALREAGLLPATHVVLGADGGLVFYLFGHERSPLGGHYRAAFVTEISEGPMFVMRDTRSGDIFVWAQTELFDLKSSIRELRKWVGL
jgi:hypothetical protein